ncbi:heterokaryon incompatibility protein-domain-containing protein [Xylaria longipes]|nr:heterokaryon incompatibility protein-domain-containing protein [Xylaria longipes]
MPELGFADTPKLEPSGRDRLSHRPNRLPLCQRCYAWGHISIHNLDDPRNGQNKDRGTTTYQSVTVEQLAQEAQCGICASVLAAYHARAQHVPNLQSRPAAEIGIEIGGPFYLDSGGHGFYSPGGRQPRHGDHSDPDRIVIGMFLRLTVKGLPPPKVGDESTMRPITSRLASGASQTDGFEASPTLFIITPRFKLTYSNDDTKTLISIDRWDVPFFDIQLLSSWLKRCEDGHAWQCGGKEAGKEDLPAEFRVIDTYEDKITKPDGSFRYVALSYMWKVGPDNNIKLEKANTDLLAAPHSLRQVQLPNIITDAIGLCRDLGERYLWIDRLCIIQDDEITKPGQINAMDTIYRSASFTIIGALNTRDDIGLPGYTGRPRHFGAPVWSPHYTVEVETQGVICEQTADDAIDTTVWNHRGWTFQERLLSRRCLYITHHQVLYKCCQEEAMEMLTWTAHSAPPFLEGYGHDDDEGNCSGVDSDTSKSSKNSPIQLTQTSGNAGVFSRGKYARKGTQFTIQDGIRLVDYCTWVKDYSSRQLSVAKDAFNAFAGVSNALRESFNSQMLFGMPERHVAVCLCWDCPGPFSPRGELHDVPSWSWVSSSSAVTYDCESEILGRDFLHIASLVYFHYQDPGGNLRKLHVEERWLKNVISIRELSELEELPPLSGKGIPGEWRTNRDWKECLQNPWKTYERQVLDADTRIVAVLFPGSLVFNTTVASLKIGKPSSHANSQEEANVTNAFLVNANDEHVGTLRTMGRGWIETHCSKDGVQRLFEFAVISGRLQEYYKRKMSAWEERYSDIWELNVMMVERLPCKPFVARRVGVGTVTMCKWKDCSPRWETVVLL